MNIPIMIPKEMTKGEELVIIPRRLFEEFKRVVKKEKIMASFLDEDLDKAVKEVKEGKIIGPFKNAKSLIKSLRLNK